LIALPDNGPLASSPIAMSSAVQSGNASRKRAAAPSSKPVQPALAGLDSPPTSQSIKYNRIFAIHSVGRPSAFSHDAVKTPSLFGFKNLMAIMLSNKLHPLPVSNAYTYQLSPTCAS